MHRQQRTIKEKISYTGIGLHKGEDVTMVCKPAAANHGIKIRRVDLAGNPEVELTVKNVTSTKRCTTIGNQEFEIHTIEHLMSAFNALKIDNLLIELNANEPPVIDGSAKVFYELLTEVGIKKQSVETEIYQVKKPLEIREGKQYLILLPDDKFKISYTFVSDYKVITDQFAEFEINQDNFYQEIAPARTFGFAHEIEALKRMGLALGGSLDNAVLIEKDGPVNQLRFKKEFVRHKILDIIGDMKLIPEFNAHIIAVRSGHKLNYKLATKLRQRMIEEERR